MSRERTGTFFQRVYDIVAQIPPGTVATYGQIALLAGSPRAARQVGYAMRAAPDDRNLPCHRVVSKSGALAPEHVFGARWYQRALLEGEGLIFLPDGCIDMRLCQWHGGGGEGI